MKILLVSQYFWPETFRVNDLAQELVLRGNEVTVLTGKPNYPQGAIYKGYSFWGYKKEYYKVNYEQFLILRQIYFEKKIQSLEEKIKELEMR